MNTTPAGWYQDPTTKPLNAGGMARSGQRTLPPHRAARRRRSPERFQPVRIGVVCSLLLVPHCWCSRSSPRWASWPFALPLHRRR